MSFDEARSDTHDNDTGSSSAAVDNDEGPVSLSELPFLVTHWLANYQESEGEDPERSEARERLRNATSEMAAAFSSLGAYGTASRPTFRLTESVLPPTRNATYGDMVRRWQPVPPSHLEALVQAATSATVASESVISRASTNLLFAAIESQPDYAGGRRLTEGGPQQTTTAVPTATCILQTPALLVAPKEDNQEMFTRATRKDKMPLSVASDSNRLGQAAGKAMCDYLSLREEHQQANVEMKRLEDQVAKQQRLREDLEKERASILALGNEAVAERTVRLNQIAEGLLNTDRLIPQHAINLSRLEEVQKTRTEKLRRAKQESKSVYSILSSTMKRFRDPSFRHGLPSIPVRIPSCVPRERSSFFDTITRQYSAGGSWSTSLPRRIQGATPSDAATAETKKSILVKRLTYSMTASAHLAFPIFCLCFDRTGRYFVTGADDCLVKLFYIGAARSSATTQRTFSYGSNDRSAVLVCTLRGHAGVICDINVSSDNAFLATASDDGDCRVWGLKDGAPIAILRGHKDGANMVSWSALAPYRLVTTASDGLSRMWDIREAARNRYRAHVGKREDYALPSLSNGTASESSEATVRGAASPVVLASRDELLPPLPVRNSGPGHNGAASQGNEGAVAANVGEGADNANAGPQEAGGDNDQPGQFVRNDNLDEGVRLVTKLQHGAPTDENLPGTSTRSRRKAVKVICIARCPRGGHFATGADDGICRVWSEEDVEIIANQDAKHSSNPLLTGQRTAGRRSVRVQQHSEGRLLAEFTGHLNSITDLHYSNAGDRIVTASQKDGVARVWSWTESPVEGGGARFEKVKQILLQGKKPESTNSSSAPARRRPAASNASCDVAVWTADDSKIVTSQSCLVREGSAEIVEGSQYVLVWDSRTGQCLLGIAAAHNEQVPVLVPHPSISSLLCSAGGDGVAKLWDLEKGECILMHENRVLDIGPVGESNEQRKHSGYLDGSFSPDGFSLVLTDDSGRFTMFNIASNSSVDGTDTSSSLRRSSPSDQRIPSWMKEQYFANDYYELYFDTNGYCVERGSGQPPHLAPRSARCSFSGAPWVEEVNDTFSRLVGPLPLPEYVCRRNRDEIRYLSFLSETDDGPENKRANLVSYFDPLQTALIDGKSSSVVLHSNSQNESAAQPGQATGHATSHGVTRRNRSPNVRNLSSNYRWSGYDDILAEEAARDEEEDNDDDEYVAPAARLSTMDEELSDGFFTSESEDEEDNTRVTRRRAATRSRSGRNRRRRRERERNLIYEEQSRSRPTRVSARALSRSPPEHYEVESDSDSIMEEFLSTNNTPSGPHVQDYTVAGHFFRLPDSGRVKRQWLLRTENRTSHNGVKNYAPQVGDSVVYIPRAHYETLKVFPTLDAPWKHFPSTSRWPVVCCRIRDVRYRFPYEQYYRSRVEARCLSVVAILTLEVTGIPALSDDRTFPWPKASFVGLQSRGKVFEVSMFESDCPEFVIPEALFTWRLESLENASGRTRRQNELPVVAYFATEEDTRSRNRREDREMESFPGTLKTVHPNSERVSDENLQNSGYGTLEVEWEDSSGSTLSPWEVALQDKVYETPPTPSLSSNEKQTIAKALAKIEARQDVAKYFLCPVDETRYSDYRNRVELPMDFSFIKERLAGGYYSNVCSVLSDARLIRDNCTKYNGTGDLSNLASDVYDEFENEIKDDIDTEGNPPLASMSLVPADAMFAEVDSSRAQRLARRQSHESNTRTSRRSGSDGGSSLERLPAPEQRTSSSQNTRRRSAGEAHTPAPSRRKSRTSEPEAESTTLRRTRSSSNKSVIAVDHEDDPDSEPPEVDDTREEEYSLEGSESGSDQDVTPNKAPRRANRKSTRLAAKTGSTEAAGISSSDEWEEKQKSSSSEDEEESDGSPPPSRTSTRLSKRRTSPRRSNAARSTRTRSVSSTLSGDIDSPRRSSRSRKRKSMADLSHSDVDEDESRDEDVAAVESESEDDVGEEETPVKTRGSLKKRSDDTPELSDAPAPKRRKQSPANVSSRNASKRPTRNTRAAKSLADLNDSGVEDDDDHASEEEEKPQRAPRIRIAAPKRARGKASEPQSSKKTRSKSKESDDEFPELKPWPEIDLKYITKVSNAVLRHMAMLDEDGLFATPVVEQVPDLAETYSAVIETPMDFRTIEEDRIQYYASVHELQDDLILVFRNCVTFNDNSSEYYAFAITLWEQLNEVFRNVCKEQGVTLPRRW